jgi:hypothetical protein
LRRFAGDAYVAVGWQAGRPALSMVIGAAFMFLVVKVDAG